METLRRSMAEVLGKSVPACLILILATIVVSCGGGGSSGGGVGAFGFADAVSLVSITFPKSTDLMEVYDAPPKDAPLSQQIVFTFSGPVEGPVTSSSILIYSDAGSDYDGPLVLFDPEKNLVLAKGTFEVFTNVVVFTPALPKTTMKLDKLNAGLDELPGLLPERTYDIFVPVGTSGAIPNLLGVDPGVKNPESFTTVSKLASNLFFKNFPLEPPAVTKTQPKDGRTDFPVNTLKVMAGFEPFEEMRIAFDQPLNPDMEKLKGEDGNGDGIVEPNLFLRFSERLLYASTYQFKGLFRLDRKNPGQVDPDGFKLTQVDGVGVPLDDVAFDLKGRLLGLSKGVLYSLDVDTVDPVVELDAVLDTGIASLKGLACSREGFFYSMDPNSGVLVRIRPETGETEEKGHVEKGETARDLACGMNDGLYLLRVEGGGGAVPWSYIDSLNPDNGSAQPVFDGLAGAFASMEFVDSHTLCLFEEQSRSLWMLNLVSGDLIEVGPIAPPWNAGVDLAARAFDMEVEPLLEENGTDGALLSISPKGMLPFGHEMEIMVRNSLENIRGWSLSDENEDQHPPLGATGHAVFSTIDPGPGLLEDEFCEEFDDNLFESTDHALGHAGASWNIQDLDGIHPFFEKLVASFGMGGSGELGDFKPTGLFPVIILDTDYQPLPLFDGSTPDVNKPVIVKGGVFQFEDIEIPNGITLHARGSNPLVLIATGSVEVSGVIDVSGLNAINEAAFDSGYIPLAGGLGGAGAGRGGMGQPPVPPDFQAVSQLRTPPTGETGYDPTNLFQIGGRGGDSGAAENVPYLATQPHKKSRGAGGGGGSMLVAGTRGMDGKGTHVPDENGNPVPKKPPEGGGPGDAVFSDEDLDNDFFGPLGEVAALHGGQGGGGAGTRWDSLNPDAAGKQPAGLPVCYFDSKGGGGGGGGGAVAIHALGAIKVAKTGRILAHGGRGGGGEQMGAANLGGAGGGGSGGAVILHSGKEIILEENPSPDVTGAVIDVSGGRFGDAKESESVSVSDPGDTCPLDGDPPLEFCSLSKSDGGQGGYGNIQLMVNDPENNLSPPPSQILGACLDNRIQVGATVFIPDWNDLTSKGKPRYKREFLTYDSDPGAYPKTYYYFSPSDPPPPPEDLYVLVNPPLVNPLITTAELTPVSYGLSKWIDLGAAKVRPDVSKDPHIPSPAFSAFRGIDPVTGNVITENGYVKDYHKPGWNDIEVDAPCLGKNNFIPDDNEVVVAFQGADAVAPGLHVPDEDKMSEWTPDITTLSGYQFVRFRVTLNVAKSGTLELSSTRPQVNKIRIRVTY